MINLFEPRVEDASLDLLQQVFQSKWLGRGAYVTEFENRLSAFLQLKSPSIHTVSCCTDVIFGAFEILGLRAGMEVIIPSVSFPAVGSSILASGLIPRIVDIDLVSGNISLEKVADSITPNTGAVFVTHYGGIPVDIECLRGLVGPNVFIIEDAACALGTFVNDVACGTEGDLGCWSFDAMKLLTCGEGGGAICSRSREDDLR